MKKLTNERFLKKANKIHNNKLIYLEKYINSSTKIKMKCKKCGLEFEMRQNNHISKKQGCPYCNRKHTNKKEYIEKVNKIHDGKYNYDNLPEIITKNKINIICSKHGSFFQNPNTHLSGSGCPKCGKYQTEEEFKKKIK